MTPTETTKAGPAPLPRVDTEPACVSNTERNRMHRIPASATRLAHHTTIVADPARPKTMSLKFAREAVACAAVGVGSVWGITELWMAVAL